jgi:hypothetical protein
MTSAGTCDVSRPYRSYVTYLRAEEISSDFFKFIFLVLRGQGCPKIFGEIVLVGRDGVSLIIFAFDKVKEHKFCVLCVLMIHLWSCCFY